MVPDIAIIVEVDEYITPHHQASRESLRITLNKSFGERLLSVERTSHKGLIFRLRYFRQFENQIYMLLVMLSFLSLARNCYDGWCGVHVANMRVIHCRVSAFRAPISRLHSFLH